MYKVLNWKFTSVNQKVSLSIHCRPLWCREWTYASIAKTIRISSHQIRQNGRYSHILRVLPRRNICNAHKINWTLPCYFSLALCNTCINFFNFMIFPFRLIVCIYLKVQNVGMSGMSWWEKSFGIRKGCWTAGRYGCLVSLWAVDRVSLLSCCSTVNTIG